MAPTENTGLFNPENFGAGGFLDDVDCTTGEVTACTQEELPFEVDNDGCYIKVPYVLDEGDGEPRNEFYRIGDLDKFTPSTDHKKIVVAAGAKMNKSTKAALLINSLVAAGFPAGEIPADNSLGFLSNLHVHVNAVEMTIKGGGGNFKAKKNADGTEKKPTVVLITKLLDAKKAGGKKAASTPKAAPAAGKAAPAAAAAAPAAASGAAAAVEAAVVGMLSESGELAKRLLPTKLLAAITDAGQRTEAFKLAGNNAWLGSEERPWAFDEKAGTLAMNERTAEFLANAG